MKRIKISLSIIVLILFAACQTELDDTDVDSTTREAIEQDISKTENADDVLSRGRDEDPGAIFEENLQVLSYAVATVVFGNEDARLEVENLLGFGNSIPLTTLLPNHSDDPESSFETEFRNFLVLHYFDGGRPGGSTQRPGNQNVPPPTGVMESANILYELFVQYVRDDNCVELFFPNGLDFEVFGLPTDASSIISTAHPLNEDEDNRGYIRYSEPVIDDSGESHYTFYTEVSQSVVDDGDIVIVSRPIRNNGIISGNCTYTEYTVDDFRDFLNR